MLKLYHCYWLLLFVLVKGNLSAQNLNAEIIMPGVVESADLVSIIVRVKNADQSINTFTNGVFQILSVNAILENPMIKIKRGVGSITTHIFASDNFTISVEGLLGQKTISVQNDLPISNQSGEISENTLWMKDSIYYISEDLTILPTAKLTIESGVRVCLEEKVNLIVQGNIQINGILEEPVMFRPYVPEKPWGGIRMLYSNDSSNIHYGFFTLGGNNDQYIFGHSNSQPVLLADHSVLNISNSFFIDNPGKALGGLVSVISINNCLISRCDTGGEYDDCNLNVLETYFIDFPSDDGIPVDDDNDAIYVYGVYPAAPGPSIIDKCTFITGKDDGVDHNGSVLEVGNCWIEGFYHEGIAVSNTNSLTAYNTLIKDCEQGIEAGYYTPQVFIDHCVMINNSNGLRFGDSYNWGCGGHITATNSILFDNVDNILNYDLLTQGPVPGAISISYSMTNDPDYDAFPNCITGTPLFDSNYFLQPGSAGIGMATDGGNLGLVDPLLNIFDQKYSNGLYLNITPNPFREITNLSFTLKGVEDKLLIKVFNSFGMLQYTQEISNLTNGVNSVILQSDNLPKGFYLIGLYHNNNILGIQKAIKL
jgi:hypothetical protein